MDDAQRFAERIARLAQEGGARIAVAESLTGGALASALAAAPQSSEWFCGGVVAYRSETKFSVLGVRPGPVVTAQAAVEMAAGVATLMDATVAISVTGAGGPEPQDGQPVGTVFIAAAGAGLEAVRCCEHHFPGTPEEVVAATVRAALKLLAGLLSGDGVR